MAIYRSGTASLDASGKAVGTGTKWKETLSLIRIGATVIFLSGSKPVLGSIAEIISDTEMNLIGTAGQTAASGEYVILLSDSITVDGLAQDVAETLRYYQSQETNVADIVDFLNNTDLQAEIDKMQELIAQSGANADEALASELKAKQWASEREDTEVEPGLFSSYHYSRKSQESAAESEASNQESAASAAASDQSAQESEVSNQASAASAAAAKVSEDNAKASEVFVDVALAVAFRDRGVLTDEDLNEISTIEKQGLYGMPADSGATPVLNYPEQKAGTLMVTRGSFGGVIQTYIVAETSMAYARALSADLNESKDGPWAAWKHIGFMSSSTPVESLDLARTPGRYLLNAASTGNPIAGTAATLEVIAYNADNIRQDVSAALSSGANANRHFSRVGTFSGGANIWGEWVEFVTVKTNGITNTIRGFQSQVTLPADAGNPLEAVTLRQMQQAISAVSSSGGVNGVMSTFIGDVSWWTGNPANIPTGYVALNGQLSNRTTDSEVWSLINAGVLKSVTDAVWLATVPGRGNFSTGDGSTTFRYPDLNGAVSGSVGGLFLRGSNAPDDAGPLGSIRANSAPNVTGSVTFHGAGAATIMQGSVGALVAATQRNSYRSGGGDTAGANSRDGFALNLNASNAAYGRDSTTEVRPNSVSGTWIMRVKGTFSAQTSFGVFISESQLTANSQKRGGAVRSVYTAGGVDYAAKMEVVVKTDANKVATKSLRLGVEGGTGEIEILPDGTLFGPYKIQGKSLASTLGGSEFNITNEGTGTIQGYHTPDITKINFNGLDIDAGNISGFGVVAAKGNAPAQTPGNGSFLSSPAVRSYLWGRGGYSDPNGAFFGFYHQENVGNYARGVMTINGYGVERNWIFWNSGVLDGPFGTIQGAGSDVRLKYDIVPAKQGAAERIESIGVVEYTEKGTNLRKRGFISQQVDTVDTLYTDMGGENIDENGDKYEILNINDRAIMADMIVTMQEMRKEMKKLQDEISKLRGE